MPRWDAEALRHRLGQLTDGDLRCLLRSALSVPLGVGLVAAGCGGDTAQQEECGTVGCDAACGDGVDNDRDGRIDCADSDCVGAADCGVPIYGIAYETDCDDDLDNDSDNAVDCADQDCINAPNCLAAPYGIPIESDCANGIDDDGDGYVDCRDGDCLTDPECFGLIYGIPY